MLWAAGVLAAAGVTFYFYTRGTHLADDKHGNVVSVEPLELDSHGLALPKKLGSVRFAVMGDVGRGDQAQYETGAQMARWHEQFPFDFVLMLGDNLYGSGTPDDYGLRFERPYKALLDEGVTFHAVLGNHDPPGEETYPLFHMEGRRYYTFSRPEGPVPPIGPRRVQFFAVDTVNVDAGQLQWLARELDSSRANWKIAFYHHPLYTSGRYSFSAYRLRGVLEPIFRAGGLDVGFNGHDHLYERIVLRYGIQYFTSGAGGALRTGDLKSDSWRAQGFDKDTHFMLVEISGDSLYFQTISRTGATVDSGRLERAAAEMPAH
ncbi:MAG: metallophosphoesterase [Vicinamibacterales bacterium]